MTVSREASALDTEVTTSIMFPCPWMAPVIWVSAARVCLVMSPMTFCSISPKPGAEGAAAPPVGIPPPCTAA